MHNYFKKSILYLPLLLAWLSSSAHSKTYPTSDVAFNNKIKDSLIIVKYPNGHRPDLNQDIIYVAHDRISPIISVGPNDMIGLFRFIDVGVPKPSEINDENKESFIRAFTHKIWFKNTHWVSPEAYSFYYLRNFNTDKKTIIKVEPDMDLRRGKPELYYGHGYTVIPIGKPSEVLK